MLTAKEQSLLNALEPMALQRGIEIVTIEITGAKKAPVIRIYISAEGGVSFTELTEAQAWISEMLDAIDPFPGAYMLEVSSPGIDRPLRTQTHFQNAVGETIRLKTTEPFEGRKHFKGQLQSVEHDQISIVVDNQTFAIPFSCVQKASVIGTVEF